MSVRSAAELDVLMRRLGTDIDLRFRSTSGMFEDADVEIVERGRRTARRARHDMGVVRDVDAAVQQLANRIKTVKGELTALGHPEYGSRHHELIGQPNVERTRNLIKLYVLEALSHEPRIAEIVRCDVVAAHQPPREQVRVVLDIRLIDVHRPLNLVVPFSLAGATS